MSISGETPRVVPVDDADKLRADIVATRAELGDTLDRLAAKLDVKGRATRRVDEVRSAVLERARPYRKQIALAVVGVLVLSVLAKRRAS